MIECLTKDVLNANGDYQVRNRLVLAMAHSRLGHAEEARTWLEKANQWITAQSGKQPGSTADQIPTGWEWSSWLALQLLRREAEALILEKGEK